VALAGRKILLDGALDEKEASAEDGKVCNYSDLHLCRLLLSFYIPRYSKARSQNSARQPDIRNVDHETVHHLTTSIKGKLHLHSVLSKLQSTHRKRQIYKCM
jgi:hypothetical protein